MATNKKPLKLMFLGSGNAYGPEGRAFSSFLANTRYMFDCGPTVLQQLHRAGLTSNDVDVVLISHFHADHYFGLPFLFLESWHLERTKDLTVVGPPGIEERVEQLMALAYPSLPAKTAFRRYVEVADGVETAVAGIRLKVAAVEHVPELQCFAFQAEIEGRKLVYSGDTTLCSGLLRLVEDAEVVVLECSCAGESVHLSRAGVAEVGRYASPSTKFVVTHLDGYACPGDFDGLLVASDLASFSF